MPQSLPLNLKITPGSRSDVGSEYRYKVIVYVAASLSQNPTIKDFVIYSKLKSFGTFDDLVLKLWFEDENLPYAHMFKIKHKSGNPINIHKTKSKKPKESPETTCASENLKRISKNIVKEKQKARSKKPDEPISIFENLKKGYDYIVENKNSIQILQDVPTANINFWFYCNNDIEENTQTNNESDNKFIKFNQTSNPIVPFKISTGSCQQIRLPLAQTHQEFLNKFYLLLNQPDVDKIVKKIAKICGIVESADITDYVYEYFKVPQLFTCGLTKINFEIELLQIHLRNYIVRPTKIIDVNEEQAHIWNRVTIEHQLTIVDNVPDIRRILFGCFVHKINKLFNHDLKWDDCLHNEEKLDDVTVGKAKEFFANNSFLQWLPPPETIKSLVDYLWLCDELPLILKIYQPLPILAKYKHLNKRFLIISDSSAYSEETAYAFSHVFTNMSDIHVDSLKNELLRNIVISLQGKKPVALYDIIGFDQKCMKTLTCSEILHLIRKRKLYLEKRCLIEAESTVFIIQDEYSNTDKNINTLEADDNDTIVINCKPEEREWYIKQIKENPKYNQHSICCLRSVNRKLEFLNGDMNPLRRYFIDDWGGYIYCIGEDQPIPIIGQRLDNKPQVYMPRYLQKAIIPTSFFKTQERRICLLSGDIDSLEYDIKQQLLKEDIDYNVKIMLENNQNVLISDKIQSPSEYWVKFSCLNCPLFHVKTVKGCMELVNYKNCSNMSSYVSYSKESSFIENDFSTEINSKIIVISGEPGIGKSSLLRSLSEATDEKNYVLFCNLADYRRDLTLDNKKLFENPLDFIFNKFKKATDNGLLHFLYKYHKTKDRLTLFIDSFDELLPMHKKSLLLFMQTVAKFNIQIIVASRLFFDTLLINNFEVQPVKVDTLKEFDYTTYFQSKCMSDMNLKEIPNEFLTSPLFLTFLWFFYGEGTLDFTQISKFDLFKKIIMKKIERYYHKTKLIFDPEIKGLINDVLRMHREIALVVVFGKELIIEQKLIKNYEKLLVSFKTLKMRLGIVKHFNDGYAVFMHQTFAEFLAAEWLYEKFLDGDFDLPTQAIYEKMLLEHDVNVRYLFDSMVCAKLKLHKAILEGKLGLVQQLANEDERNLTQTDKCGRNALILAASYCYDKNYEILEETVVKSHPYRIDLQSDFLMKWNWLQYLDKLSKDSFFDRACNYNVPATISKYLSCKHKLVDSSHVLSAYRNNNLDMALILFTANPCSLKELFIPITKDAIEQGRLDVAFRLITLNYNILLDNRSSDTIFTKRSVKLLTNGDFADLHLACMLSDRKSVNTFSMNFELNYTDVDTKDIFGNCPFHYVIIGENLEIHQEFISKLPDMDMKDQVHGTYLHFACKYLKTKIAELLLHLCESNIHEKNSKGETPLHTIAYVNWQQITKDEVKHSTSHPSGGSVITPTYKKGSNFINTPKCAEINTKFLLQDVFRKKVTEIADILLIFGSDVTQQDNEGNTALHLAYRRNNGIVLERLIQKYDGIAFIKNRNGLSVFEIAKHDKKMDLVNFIQQHTSNITQYNRIETDIMLNESEEIFIKSELRYTGEQERTLLHAAAIKSRSDIILLLLEKGLPVNVPDNEGNTPLHFVKSTRDAQLLLNKFNNMEEAFQKSNTGETPLCTACRNEYLDVVRFLLSHKIDLVKTTNKNGQTPLHLSAMADNMDVAAILLSRGANVNDTDTNKATALHLAISKDSASFVDLLLKNNANICLQNNFGNTALHLACLYGHTKLVERLIKESPETISICNAEGYKAFELACAGAKYDAADVIIKCFPLKKQLEISTKTLFHIVTTGSLEILKMLVEQNIIQRCDLESRDSVGNTLLHLASVRNHYNILHFLLENQLEPDPVNYLDETPLHFVQSNECAEMLLSKYKIGSNPHSKTKLDQTPLHRVSSINADVVQTLLNAKADVSSKDSNGWTPLHVAAWANRLDVVQVLLRNGAKVNETNSNSATALHYAATNDLHLFKILLNSGANVNAVGEIIYFSPDEKFKEIKDQTVLDIACFYQKHDIIEYLLKNHHTQKKFNLAEPILGMVIYEGDLRSLKMLFDQQALPHNYFQNIDTNRFNYLQWALESDCEDVVSFLLDQDGYLNLSSNEIESIVLRAGLKNYIDVVTTLVRKTELSLDEKGPLLKAFIMQDNLKLVSILLNRNSDLNKKAGVLHRILVYGHFSVLDVLLKGETDFNIKDVDGYNSLEFILLYGHDSRVTCLLEKNPSLRKCSVSRHLFFKLVIYGDLVALQILFEEKNSDDILLFLDAKFRLDKSKPTTGNFNNENRELSRLIIYPPLIHDYLDFKYDDGGTALHLAVLMGGIDIVRFLIEKGSNIDAVDNYCQTSLHLAVWTNSIDIVRLLLECGANVNATEIHFQTALHYAAWYNLLPVLEVLLDYNADIESLCNYGYTALHIAVNKGNIAMVQVLLEKGANVDATSICFSKALRIAASGTLLPILEMLLEYNAMIQSSDNKDAVALQNIIELLLVRCVSVNESNNHYESERNRAASENMSSILDLLLECNFNIVQADNSGNTTSNFELMKDNKDIKQVIHKKCAEANLVFTTFNMVLTHAEALSENRSGRTALHLAVRKNNIDITQLLLEKYANVNATDSSLRTPLVAAASRKRLSVAEILLDYNANTNSPDAKGRIALHYAVRKNHVDMVQLLIEKGSNVNASDICLETALHYAAILNRPSITWVLLDHNADVELTNWCGLTVLHCAVIKGNIDIVRILLERHANVNAYSLRGTVLHIAASQNLVAILELLLNYNSNFQLTDNYGNTPLDLAYAKGNILTIELLKKRCTKSISIRNDALQFLFNHTPVVEGENISTFVLHSIVERGRLTTLKLIFDRNIINKNDLENRGKCLRSLLHTATINNRVDIVRFLLDKGVKVNPSDIHGFTPLHLAWSADTAEILLKKYTNIADAHGKSQSGRTPLHTASLNGHIAVIRLLLSADAELTARDTCGWTALLLATYKNQDSCVQILLNSGADANEMNNCNETALHLAVQNGNWTLVNILLENGADVRISDWSGNTPLHSMMNMFRWYSWFVKSPLYNCELPVNNVTNLIHTLLQHAVDSKETNRDQERAIEIVENLRLNKLPDL